MFILTAPHKPFKWLTRLGCGEVEIHTYEAKRRIFPLIFGLKKCIVIFVVDNPALKESIGSIWFNEEDSH